MASHSNCIPRTPSLSMNQSARMRWLTHGKSGQTTRISEDTCRLAPNAGDVLFSQSGNGFIQSICLTAPSDPSLLQIKIFTGEENLPAIEQSAANFFLTCRSGKDVFADKIGKSTSQNKENSCFYRTLCIPFQNGCRIEIENKGSSEIFLAFSVQYCQTALPPTYGRFSKVIGMEKKGRARFCGEEVVLLNHFGKGALHSIQLSMDNRESACYMEGNLEIYIDGNSFPEYQSTGTEEFFMGGIYFTNLHENAYSGCSYTFNDGGDQSGYAVSAHRIFEEDPITFDSHIRIVWHNGQPNQGPVCGGTEYDFAAVCYTEDPALEAVPAVSYEEAASALAVLDENRFHRELHSVSKELCSEEPDPILFQADGAGNLELLYLSFDNSKAAENACISFEIDGKTTEPIPVPLFFRCPRQYEGTAIFSSSGKTGSATYYRYLDIFFCRSIAIRLHAAKQTHVDCRTEYRVGIVQPFYRTEILYLTSTQAERPVLLAEGEGLLDEIVFEGKGIQHALAEITGSDAVPLATVKLPSLVRADQDFYTQGSAEETGVVHGCGSTAAYRSFVQEHFSFSNGLRIRIHPKKCERLDMLLFCRILENSKEAPCYSESILETMNRLDGACDMYEGRCYNPVEGPDGTIPPGETRLMLEDFGAGVLRCIRLGTPPYGPALHEARLKIYLNGEETPSIDTTCSRFFSAAYEDPIYWSHTKTLCRLSKRGAENSKNVNQHSGFFRYLNIPYQNGIRITLTAPEDSKIDGFDNFYYACSRAGAQPFGMLDRSRMISRTVSIPAHETRQVALWAGRGAITSIQLQTAGKDSEKAVLEVHSKAEKLVCAPLWQYFMGAPPEEHPPVLGDYSDFWRSVIEKEEGYYSAPENGWIRRGRLTPFRHVFYRILEKAPILLNEESCISITNPTEHDISVFSDIIVRFGEEERKGE